MGSFDHAVIANNLPFLLEGLELSLLLTLIGISGGILFGTLLAVARLSSNRVASLLAAAYVNALRSVPLVLVVFWFFFLVPLLLGRPVGAFYSVTIAFGLFEAAYYCEIIKAGIQSVSHGQFYAALASGMSSRQAMRLVILPQAFRNMVPVLLTQGIVLFQDTSLVYVVSLRDFMTAASIVANRDSRLVELYTFAAAVYFTICFLGSLGVRFLGRGLAYDGR